MTIHEYKLERARATREEKVKEDLKLKLVLLMKSHFIKQYRQHMTESALKLNMLRKNIIKVIVIIVRHLLLEKLYQNFKTKKKIIHD